jgi:hypothetical protein
VLQIIPTSSIVKLETVLTSVPPETNPPAPSMVAVLVVRVGIVSFTISP